MLNQRNHKTEIKSHQCDAGMMHPQFPSPALSPSRSPSHPSVQPHIANIGRDTNAGQAILVVGTEPNLQFPALYNASALHYSIYTEYHLLANAGSTTFFPVTLSMSWITRPIGMKRAFPELLIPNSSPRCAPDS